MTPEAPFRLSEAQRSRLGAHLAFLYGDGDGDGDTLARLCDALEGFAHRGASPSGVHRPRLDTDDAVLITYADGIREPSAPPLATLRRFVGAHLTEVVNTVHLLPFYPATSDDGFSVSDYLAVDPAFGDWEDVAALASEHRLMLDAVINHVSTRHPWFQAFLRDEAPYRDYFVTADPDTDLSSVVRPRTTPLLTPFETAAGTRHVWTTFSADQVDLDYANPEVLLEIVDVVLTYVEKGASILRLDAVTYLWKEIGTSCVHHPRTHEILRLLRSVMDAVAPHVVLLSETNVPHDENVAYFGDGHDEAHMVYNFALPPLVLHAFAHGDARTLSDWAASLVTPSDGTCFFNFLASHDGIGVRGVEDLLGPAEVAALAERVRAHGGLVSHKSNADGSTSPYELNVSLFDALNDPRRVEPSQTKVDRFLCAHAIMLALAGVPGIYLHSLLGSGSDHEGARAAGYARAINREKLALERVHEELRDRTTVRSLVLEGFRTLLRTRRSASAFHPTASQRVQDAHPGVFALRRGRGESVVTCLHNVSEQRVAVRRAAIGLTDEPHVDLTEDPHEVVPPGAIELAPYGVAWLARRRGRTEGTP